MPDPSQRRYTHADRLDAVRQVLAGGAYPEVAARVGVTVRTLRNWKSALGKEAAGSTPSTPGTLHALPSPPVDRFALDKVERLRHDIAHMEATAEYAEGSGSFVAALGYRKAALDLWEKLEALEHDRAKGIDGGDPDAVAAEVATLCAVPALAQRIMSDHEAARTELLRWA